MKVLICGDLHGQLNGLEAACQKAKNTDCDLIIQLGDFGFIFNDDMTVHVEKILSYYQIEMFYLDGNHENFDLMEQMGIYNDSPFLFQVTDHLSYLPRGCRFSLGSASCMAFGGASSIDRAFRSHGIDWWPQEAVTQEQIDKVSDEHVDILFTHDVPGSPPNLMSKLNNSKISKEWKEQLPAAEEQRNLLYQLKQKVKPAYIYHGHYHVNYDDVYNNTVYTGITCYGYPDFYKIIDIQ